MPATERHAATDCSVGGVAHHRIDAISDRYPLRTPVTGRIRAGELCAGHRIGDALGKVPPTGEIILPARVRVPGIAVQTRVRFVVEGETVKPRAVIVPHIFGRGRAARA